MTRASLIAATIAFALAAPAALADVYPSADEAVAALVQAVAGNDPQAIEAVLGPGSKRLVESGDPVADKAGREGFTKAYNASHSIEPHGDQAYLVIGADAFPFPIPLHHGGDGWRFDVRAGAEQILDRRIGREELDAIEVCRAIVEAERDYASEDRTGSGVAQYAGKFVSDPGKKNGLYWPSSAGEAQSPLGPLVTSARAQGYHGHHVPYHGYYYKLLTRQGPHATGGARNYIVKGHMIGGFAVVAYPAKWGDSGVMTFVVDEDGTVYEKSLGRGTAKTAAAMTRYDPDASWKPVAEEGK
jgi:hypothetical protein